MNGFVHIEIPSKDLNKAKAFYEGVFNWKVNSWEGGEKYMVFETGDGLGGGFTPSLEVSSNGGPLLYIQVADIPDSLKKIDGHGGKTITPKTAIPGMGFYAVFSDTEGNQIGLYADK